jgi:phenylacetic acid degradation operon negative regulatory protein
VDARSALFDLYGDHLRARGAQAPVAALVRMLASLGIASPAVRTAISRMVRQGWLQPVRIASVAGYALTPRAVRRLDEAADRIYTRGGRDWDGGWHLVVVERIRERTRRERVQASLRYLGYAQLDDTTWLSPRPSPELEVLRETERLRLEPFAARYDGDPRGLLARAWDLDALARAYESWLTDARELIAPVGAGASDETIFAARSRLVHGWRKFLFRDPGLPAQLLPEHWPGTAAADFFHVESARLLPAASRFVDCCLAASDSRAARAP